VPPMLALVAVNLLVIIGNVMVIAAVFTHSKLRSTTTNKFVVSLAVADLMVGLIVLPFSSVNQVTASVTRVLPAHPLMTLHYRLSVIDVRSNVAVKSLLVKVMKCPII